MLKLLLVIGYYYCLVSFTDFNNDLFLAKSIILLQSDLTRLPLYSTFSFAPPT